MADDKYISGEENIARSQSSKRPAKQVTVQSRYVAYIIAVVVLCGLSFWAGMAREKHDDKTVTPVAAAGSGGIGGGSGGFARRGGIGEVTAVSSSSITISNARTGTDTTYTINSSTQITSSGQSANLSDIQTGDTVLVTTSSSSSTLATRILLNPSFGGGFGGGGGGGSSDSSQGSADATN